MKKPNLLFITGGQSQEHDISLVSANYLQDILKDYQFQLAIISKDGQWIDNEGSDLEISFQKRTTTVKGIITTFDIVVPWVHGAQGESGHITATCELFGIPYLGPSYENHLICFNKALTKLWCEKLAIPSSDFLIASPHTKIDTINDYFEKYGQLFFKASHQGSSIGCYKVDHKKDIEPTLKKALSLSPYVVIEPYLEKRELEVSAYSLKGEIHITPASEIDCPDGFYDFDEKYSQESKTKTQLVAKLSSELEAQVQTLCENLFQSLQIKDFCRFDLFIVDDKVILNEINTFPGMTPISLFPKMIENNGLPIKDLFKALIAENLA